MNAQELGKIMDEALDEASNLTDRIALIREVDPRPGAANYKLWMEEINFLGEELMRAFEKYKTAFRDLGKLEKEN